MKKIVGSGQENITHIVSKETSELDKALSLTEHTETQSLSPGSDQPQSSGFTAARTEATEASAFTTAAPETPGTSGFITASPKSERISVSSLPLPLSGSLPQTLNQVSAVCPCNVQREECDINCCCDPDCTQEVALFTHCSVQKVTGDPKLCSQDAAVYTLTQTADGLSQVWTSVQPETNPDLLCVQSANYNKGMSFDTPTIPTEANFDSLFSQYVGFFFGSSSGDDGAQSPVQGNSSGYSYGDLIWTRAEDDQVAFFKLPASAGTANCLDTNPAAFLKDQTSGCTRSFTPQDCTTLEALNLRTYTNISVFSVRDSNAELVSVSVEQVTLQSLEGAHTLLEKDVAASDYQPVFPEAGEICNQVVLQVKYTVRFGDAGQILKVSASVVLGAVDKNTTPIEQKFQIQFVQETKSDATVRSSGNPGYVVGLPLVAGWRTAEGIIQSADPGGSLSVLKSSADQDCLSGSTQRSPVLFGRDVVSGCTFRLEDGANCSLITEAVLARLKGQSFPDHVASFGNSLPQNPMDWVPIENQTTTTSTQDCSIPVFYHLNVRWTKYGTLVNPQAQIVSVMETIQYNTSSLPSVSTGGGVVSVTSSVSFTDVSDSASPGFRAPPSIDAKLPFDFFFPFV
ncbi:tectonic-1 [Trichomycterus rosablanca]|uniref:tectonic-1 n=1 Tax=Trichomycterus rosablanca TaxID=2290929 RepID=UPI002F353224